MISDRIEKLPAGVAELIQLKSLALDNNPLQDG
jgi:Leucine-rich repeat (LRR) protein